MILQAVVDHEYLFRDVYVGWPGSVHDARVFANSSLYQRAHDKEILKSCSRAILGKTIFPFLVGDSAYPLSSWLMKPFPHGSTLKLVVSPVHDYHRLHQHIVPCSISPQILLLLFPIHFH